MNKKMVLRPLDAAMNDSYSTAELYTVFESQVFSKSKSMDLSLLTETVKALDDRMDGEVAPHKEFVWQKIVHRILNIQRPFALGLSRKDFAILVAALVLLITTVALALTNWNAIVEWVYHLEKQESCVEQWTLEQKEEIIDALMMTEYDLTGLPDTSGMADEEKDTAISQWLNRQFQGSRSGEFHDALMIRLNGFFDDWSMEDRAWYSDILLKDGRIAENDFVNTVPEKGQEAMDRAKELADEKLHEAFDGTEIDPNWLTPYLSYGYLYPNAEKLYWRISYKSHQFAPRMVVLVEDTTPSQYLAQISYITLAATPSEQSEEGTTSSNHTRDALEVERGVLIRWSYEQQAAFFPQLYGVPGEGDITREEAYAIARKAYCEASGATMEESEKLYCYSYFVIDEETPYYSVSFFYDEAASMLYGFTIEIYGSGEIKAIYLEVNG